SESTIDDSELWIWPVNWTVPTSARAVKPASTANSPSWSHCAGFDAAAATATHARSTTALMPVSVREETMPPRRLPGAVSDDATTSVPAQLDERDGALAGRGGDAQAPVGGPRPVLDE